MKKDGDGENGRRGRKRGDRRKVNRVVAVSLAAQKVITALADEKEANPLAVLAEARKLYRESLTSEKRMDRAVSTTLKQLKKKGRLNNPLFVRKLIAELSKKTGTETVPAPIGKKVLGAEAPPEGG